MKNKGFTLIELIATLIILSIVALIVTPNILVSISDYKKQVYDNNISAIKSAAISWAADNVSNENFPTDESSSLIVPLENIIEAGHLDENIKDLVNGGYFDDEDHETYVIINCKNIIVDDEIVNTKYTYDVYISDNDFVEQSAIDYAKDNNIKSTTTFNISELMGTYIKNNIVYPTGSEKIIDIDKVTITYNGTEYKATVN